MSTNNRVKKQVSPIFGQLVIGPPGSGKTTYCDAMTQLLSSNGRPCAVINLDPANGNAEFQPDVDIKELITLEDVMTSFSLGPNGGLIYCMEFLEANFDWLKSRIASVDGKYLLVDCPGQVELYTHNDAIKNVILRLQKELDCRLCCVHLADSHHCSDPAKFIAVCLTTLNTMVQMELPQVNLLSKVDLMEKYGKLPFSHDFYTEVLDLRYLVESMSKDAFERKHKKMTEAITDVIENYSLVSTSITIT